jgi:hypothetical protein
LACPVYCSNGTTCHVSSSQQAGIGTTIEASFGIDSQQEDFKGALLYKLQRKYVTRTDNRTDSNTTSINNTETTMYLLVVWDVSDYQRGFRVCIIESIDNFTWNEAALCALYRKYNPVLQMHYKSNLIIWSMHDGAMMKTRYDITYGSDYKLDIVISEGGWKHDMLKPMKIDTKRLVWSSSMLIVLTYTVSLPIKPLFKLNIRNQCWNVDLVSPIYITHGWLGWHRVPGHDVYAGNVMESGFITYDPDSESGGALIYRLQRRQLHVSTMTSKGTSSTTNLLVVWKCSGSNKLYADVLLVEHGKWFIWNENNLKDLYHKNINLFRLYPHYTPMAWSLDDNMVLNTEFHSITDCTLNVTIFEAGRHNKLSTPVHIDLKR